MTGGESKARARLKNVALVLVSVVICALVLEWAARALFKDKIGLFARNHAEAKYGQYTIRRLTPNISFWHESIDGRWQMKTNAQGYRSDRDFAIEKPAGVLRVLVLGDSHTQGFEVHQHETFSAVLEKRLRARGVGAEVMNVGISGFGTAEQLVYLENEGLRYRPDVVVVAVYGNDYVDSVRSGLFKLENGKLVESRYEFAPAVRVVWWTQAIPGMKWLGENSYAYSLLFNGIWDTVKMIMRREASREYSVKTGATSSTVEDLASALLLRLADSARRAGSIVILVDIPHVASPEPYRTSVEPTLRARLAPAYDRVLWSDAYLGELPPGAVVHVPNGHRHINAYTHDRIAEALVEVLTSLRARLPDAFGQTAGS